MNLEKHQKIKNDNYNMREEEKRKFSPLNSKDLRHAAMLKTGFDQSVKMGSIKTGLPEDSDQKCPDLVSRKSGDMTQT